MEIPLFGRFDLMIVGLIISLSIFLICFKGLFLIVNDLEKMISLAYFRLFILPKQLKQEQRMKELLDLKKHIQYQKKPDPFFTLKIVNYMMGIGSDE